MRSERQYLQGIVSRKKTVAIDLSTQIVDPTLPDQLSTWSFHYLWNWLESVSFAKISIRTIVRSRPRWELTSKTMIKSHITRNSFANRAYDSIEDNPSNWSKKKKNSSKHRRTHRSAARWEITTCQSSHLPPLYLSRRSSQFIASQRSSESVRFFVLSILFIFLCAALSCSSAGDLSSAWSNILTF